MTSLLWVGHLFCCHSEPDVKPREQSEQDAAVCVGAGEGLSCTPLLEILDLSWNSGIGGGGALQSLLGKLYPPLRELHLVACRLTAADAAALGTNMNSPHPPSAQSYVSHNPAGGRPHDNCVCVLQGEWCLLFLDSVCWMFPVTLSLHRKLMLAASESWRPRCLTLPCSPCFDFRPAV